MKIVLVNNFSKIIGGAEKHLIDLKHLLEANGNEVYVFSTSNSTETLEILPKLIDYKNISKVAYFCNLINFFYNREAKKKFSRFITNTKPDIVHFHDITTYLTISLLDVAKKGKIPTVMTLHNIRYFCPGTSLLKGNKIFCKDFLCIKNKNPLFCILYKCKNAKFIDSVLYAFEHIFYKKVQFDKKLDHFISPSKAVSNIASLYGICSNKISHINNFLNDKEEIHPSSTNQKYFLYAGRLSKEKGVHFLIEAFKFLPKDIKLHIVGEGPEKQRLLKQVKKNKLDNISFKGYKSGLELKTEFTNCIALFIPSCCFENNPLSVLEAFSFGKPAIGSDIGGIPELIINDRTGYTFTPGKIDELVYFIKKLYYDPDLTAYLGQNALNKVKEAVSPDYYYKQLMDIYRKLV